MADKQIIEIKLSRVEAEELLNALARYIPKDQLSTNALAIKLSKILNINLLDLIDM